MIIENLLRVQIVQAVQWFDRLTMSGSTFPLVLSFVEGCAPFKTSRRKANLQSAKI